MAVSVKITGIQKEFGDAEEELIVTINKLQRATSLVAIGDLKIATPVDTGRARNSWSLNKTRAVRDADTNPLESPILGPIPRDRVESLYITNGVPYIKELNAGSSVQAPPRFVENTLSRYFNFTAGSVKFT